MLSQIEGKSMTYVIISILALCLGVALANLIKHPIIAKVISVFVSLLMVFIIATHILPDLVAAGGQQIYYIFAIGFMIMFLFELFTFLPPAQISKYSAIIAMVGLGIHTAFDGFALFQMSHLPHLPSSSHSHAHSHGDEIIWLFILHRIPVGMFLVFQFARELGIKWIGMMVVIFSITTVAGYLVGEKYAAVVMESISIVQFQGFASGVLAHIVFEPIQLFIQNRYFKNK